jgi:hypothetical protein
MPFRLGKEGFPNRAKVQFTTSLSMPHMIYRACKATGTVSNTVYVQRAVAEALARDLGIPLEQILADLPEPRGPAKHVFDPRDGSMNRAQNIQYHQTGGRLMIGPANTIEEVVEGPIGPWVGRGE